MNCHEWETQKLLVRVGRLQNLFDCPKNSMVLVRGSSNILDLTRGPQDRIVLFTGPRNVLILIRGPQSILV